VFENSSLQHGVAILTPRFLMVYQMLVLEGLNVAAFNYMAHVKLFQENMVRVDVLTSFVFVQHTQNSVLVVSSWTQNCAGDCCLEDLDLVFLVDFFLIGETKVLPSCQVELSLAVKNLCLKVLVAQL
jgi:hypothetical protein